MKAAERVLQISLCLAAGALGVVLAWLAVGDRQPGYLFGAGAGGVVIMAEISKWKWKR